MGRWLNRSDQGERLQVLVDLVPSGPIEPRVRTSKQRVRHLDPAVAAELVAGYEAGATVYQLADQFHIHRDTVTKHLKRAQIPRRNQPLTPDQVKKAMKLYAAGQSLARIAPELGCQPSTVWSALRKAGVQLRDPRGQER
jgi:DNA-binding CsgD family transcriptional regulator